MLLRVKIFLNIGIKNDRIDKSACALAYANAIPFQNYLFIPFVTNIYEIKYTVFNANCTVVRIFFHIFDNFGMSNFEFWDASTILGQVFGMNFHSWSNKHK